MVKKIKQRLHCQFSYNNPENDPENLLTFETDFENLLLESLIAGRKKSGWNIFIPFNKKDNSHPFQDPRVIAQLKADLKSLDIFNHNYSDKAGALLFNELAQIQVWLNLYNEDRPDT